MTDQLISFETAKLAKEKGFDIGSFNYGYLINKGRLSTFEGSYNFNIGQYDNCYISAPTQSLLQKWLREIHNFFICIKCDGKSKFDFHGYPLNEETWTGQRDKEYGFGPEIGAKPYRFNSYEEALEIGLQEALKLI
jgi:hypothetical protein